MQSTAKSRTLKVKVLGAMQRVRTEGSACIVVPNLLSIEQAKSEAHPMLEQTIEAIRDLALADGGQVQDWCLEPSGLALSLKCTLSEPK